MKKDTMYKTKRRIEDRLTEVGHVDGEYYIYKDGYSDDRVSREMIDSDHKATINVVMGVRREMFGRVRDKKSAQAEDHPVCISKEAKAELFEVVRKHEKRLNAQYNFIKQHTIKINAVLDKLAEHVDASYAEMKISWNGE